MSSDKRVHGLDLARSLVVFFMVIGHCINAFNSGSHLYNVHYQFFIRMVPPTFIMLFGIMMEMVYLPMLKKNGMRVTATRLFSRTVQCYTLYVISCLVLSMKEGYSAGYVFRLIALLGATPYTDILKYYSITLLIAPLLLHIRNTKGFTPLVIFCALTHIVHTVIYPPAYPDLFPGADILFGVLYGATNIIAGPSVLHGITFVVAGMWLGRYILAHSVRQRLLDLGSPQVIWLFLAGCAVTLQGYFAFDGDYYRELSTMRPRNANSYLYFGFGIAGAIAIIDASMRFAARAGAERIKPYLFLGTTSLFVFCFGNCVLYLVRSQGLPDETAKLYTVLCVMANLALAIAFDKTRAYIAGLPKEDSKAKWFNFIGKGYADAIASKLVKTLKIN